MIANNVKFDAISNSFLSNRDFYYGLSIILVLLYHTNCFGYKPLPLFSYGYLGVDVFMFFSGLGCCYSFEKYSLIEFYRRRVERIYPLYFSFSVIVSILGGVSYIGWICDLFGLWFFNIGGIYVEWYMVGILLLYFLFPIFYYLAFYIGLIGYIAIIVTSLLLLSYVDLDWWQKALLGRIPMFYLGITWFFVRTKNINSENKNKFYIFSYIISFISLIFILIKGIKGFISIDMTTPFILIVFFFLQSVFKRVPRLQRFISLLGKYSFQLFAANALTLYLLNYKSMGVMESFVVYALFTILLTPCFVYYEKVINNFVMRKRVV